MLATDGTSRTAACSTEKLTSLVRPFLLASTILALSLGLFLLMRLVGGARTNPLPAPPLAATAVILSIWGACVQLFLPATFSGWVRVGIPLTVLLLFAIACSYPGDRIADWLTWSAAIGSLLAVFRFGSMARLLRGPGRSDARTRLALIQDENDSQQILQHLTRYRDAEGKEVVHGNLAAEFVPGERQATLFIAFCPPFERLPQVEADIADESPADVKLAQVLHNGAQLEVRLAKPASEAMVVSVEVFATDSEPG